MSKSFITSYDVLRPIIRASAAGKEEIPDEVLAHFKDDKATSLQQLWDSKIRSTTRSIQATREMLGCVICQAAAVDVQLDDAHLAALGKARTELGC